VQLEIIAAGTVEDYTPSVLSDLEAAVAALAEVDPSQVTATVVSSSVKITFDVQINSGGSISDTRSTLVTKLGTRDLAQAAFGSSLIVEASPIISVVNRALDCTVSTLSTEAEGYTCMYAPTSSLELHWITKAASTAFAVVGSSSGYVSVGVSSSSQMVGAESIIGWVDGAGVATVGAYALNGKDTSELVPTNSFSLGTTSGSYADGRTTIKFELSHANPPKHLSLTSASTWLWALGSTDSLAYHSSRGSFNLDTSSGAATTTAAPVDAYKWQLAHGCLMAFAWGIVMPIGVLVARFLKPPPATTSHSYDREAANAPSVSPLKHARAAAWYRAHRALQMAGMAMALAGMIISLTRTEFGSIDTVHGDLGLATMALGLIQPINAVLRPPKSDGSGPKKTIRTAWEVLHKSLGYIALSLGVVTIFLGIDRLSTIAGASNVAGFASYGAVLAVLLCVTFILSVRRIVARTHVDNSIIKGSQMVAESSPPTKLAGDADKGAFAARPMVTTNH